MSDALVSPSRPFSYADLASMPDDGYRREIINGSLVVTPAPSGGHQLAVVNLAFILKAAKPQDLLVVVSPYDWRQPGGDSVQPDLVVIRRSDFDPRGALGPDALPVLVVEVLSPSTANFDRSLKRALYENLGVASYWLVDATTPSVVALELRSDGYREAATASGDEAFAVNAPFPVAFRPADLIV